MLAPRRATRGHAPNSSVLMHAWRSLGISITCTSGSCVGNGVFQVNLNKYHECTCSEVSHESTNYLRHTSVLRALVLLPLPAVRRVWTGEERGKRQEATDCGQGARGNALCANNASALHLCAKQRKLQPAARLMCTPLLSHLRVHVNTFGGIVVDQLP